MAIFKSLILQSALVVMLKPLAPTVKANPSFMTNQKKGGVVKTKKK